MIQIWVDNVNNVLCNPLCFRWWWWWLVRWRWLVQWRWMGQRRLVIRMKPIQRSWSSVQTHYANRITIKKIRFIKKMCVVSFCVSRLFWMNISNVKNWFNELINFHKKNMGRILTDSGYCVALSFEPFTEFYSKFYKF